MEFAELDAIRLSHFKSMGFSPTCVFDIGASNGGWTWAMREVFPDAQFELFEPLAAAHPPYRDMLQQYAATKWRATLHPVALGNASGSTTIAIDTHAVGSSVLVHHTDETFPTIIEVPITTIDQVVASGVAPVPQLIKMDTQGSELRVLEGATSTLPQVDLLLIETWLVRGYGPETPLLGELANWLARYGFFMLDLSDCYRDPNGVLTAQDVFFVNARTTVTGLRGNRTFNP